MEASEARTARGVACRECHASTPLPVDLRTPTFRCAYCNTELQTAAYAGEGAVRVDELRGYVNARMAGASETDAGLAPKLVHGTAGTRAASCVHCQTALAVPLDVTISKVTCTGCNRTEPVSRYISDVERLDIDMQRQIAGNAKVKDLIASGLSCTHCGAHNPVPEPIPVQLTCTACSHVILLAGFAPADAIDRARLKQLTTDIYETHKPKPPNKALGIAVVVGIIVLFVVLMALTGKK